MTTDNIIIVAASVFLIAVLAIVFRYYPRRLNKHNYVGKWKKIQVYCRTSKTWPKALKESDELLKEVLRKRRFKGKTMGAKMVTAQHLFSDNDSLWHAHDLYKKVTATHTKMKQSDVIDAMKGYRQALRDLGALPKDETPKE